MCRSASVSKYSCMSRNLKGLQTKFLALKTLLEISLPSKNLKPKSIKKLKDNSRLNKDCLFFMYKHKINLKSILD